MIFQLGISLPIEQKDVQATIDLETGLIGFVEKQGEDYQEYDFYAAPIEFKKAFADHFVELAAEKSYINFEICRKSDFADAVYSYWK